MSEQIDLSEMDYKEMIELEKRMKDIKKEKREEYRLTQNEEEIEKRFENIEKQLEKLKELGVTRETAIETLENCIGNVFV